MTPTLRATTLDRRFAGSPIVAVVGPVAAPDGTGLPAVLDRMWALGIDYRIGVIPDPNTSRWRFTRPDTSWLLPPIPHSLETDVEGCFEYLFAMDAPAPLLVGLVDRHLILRIDHGITDMDLIFELLAVLSRPVGVDGPELPPMRRLGGRAAVSRIVAADAVRAPLRWATTVASAAQERTRSAEDIEAVPMRPRVVVTRSAPGYLESLLAHRGARADSPTVGALLAQTIARSMAERLDGITELHVVVSLRPRLAGRRDTAANLTAMVTIPLQPEADFPMRFAHRVQSVAVPAMLALSSTVGAVRRRRPPAVADRVPRATLSLSNLTRAASSAGIAWDPADFDNRRCLIGAPLSGPRQVTVTLSQAGTRLDAVTHFDAAAHPVEPIRSGIAEALSTTRWSP